jgi:L-lactate dehydrogenase complex protein LldE
MAASDEPEKAAPRVGLFVTCLVDLFRPSVGFAAAKLLQDASCSVEVPVAQTCCGQPAHNSGDRAEAIRAAQNTIEAFEEFDYVVAPSGTCAGMLKVHYPALLADQPNWAARAKNFAAKVHELTSFLVDVLGMESVPVRFDGTVTYHDACAGLRELGVQRQPRALLKSIEGLDLIEMRAPEMCCGSCVRHPASSAPIAKSKTDNIKVTDASVLLAGDLGCLMDMAGRLRREGSNVEVRHVAEVLAGMFDAPPIGARNAIALKRSA